MQGNCQPSMSPGLYQGFNPNESYGSNQPEVSSPQYYDLLKKYNTLLKMYRSRPATQQIRQAMPRQSALNYNVQARLPALQQQYPGVLPNLQNIANRLNVQFNPVDITNTSEYGDTPSLEEEYKGLQRELGMSTSGSKKKKRKSRGKKKTKRAKSHAGGRNRSKKNLRSKKRSMRGGDRVTGVADKMMNLLYFTYGKDDEPFESERKEFETWLNKQKNAPEIVSGLIDNVDYEDQQHPAWGQYMGI